MYECSLLLFGSMPAPNSCRYPDQFALTPNILGAIRTPPELLEASSDPCGFMWGLNADTLYPLYLPTFPAT